MSDTNFPDEQHKTAFRRLPQTQILDGGGDWQRATVAFNRTWICPKGTYEVYVCHLSSDPTDAVFLMLNGTALVGNFFQAWTDLWFPAFLVSDVVTEWTAAGAVNSATAFLWGGVLIACTLPNGWRLTGGDILSLFEGTLGSFVVRFRRVG